MELEARFRAAGATAITSDSRLAGPGTVFVAVRGTESDGHDYVDQALSAGAVFAVGERPRPDLADRYVQVADSRAALALLAARLHGHPSRSMWLIGVTGTSGKTTTTYLIESILQAAGRKVGVIGTVNFRYGDKTYPSTHTTPGAEDLQKLLAEMRADGCDAVVMEVSSHALKQKRVAQLAFDGMVFTNLSREHLDFHPDMEDYFEAKKLLFTEHADAAIAVGKRPVLAVNADDAYGAKLIEAIRQRSGAKTPPFSETFALREIQNFVCELTGVSGESRGVKFHSPLIGSFNASNILAAVTVTRLMGIKPEVVARGIEALHSVPGRLEAVVGFPKSGVQVLVDYAHKPDALEKVLTTLRALVPRGRGRLITVFGCGGDRDRTKRPVMGEIATRLSDQVIVTSDNPRTENPESIIQEIVSGIHSRSFHVEIDRKRAIDSAISGASKGDLILIAGKGHEDYQILGKTKIHFNDKEIALEALTRVFKSL